MGKEEIPVAEHQIALFDVPMVVVISALLLIPIMAAAVQWFRRRRRRVRAPHRGHGGRGTQGRTCGRQRTAPPREMMGLLSGSHVPRINQPDDDGMDEIHFSLSKTV